jgi:hypothetical protein
VDRLAGRGAARGRRKSAAGRRGEPRAISDCRFRKTATECDRKPGIKWLGCTEKWRSDVTPGELGAVPERLRAVPRRRGRAGERRAPGGNIHGGSGGPVKLPGPLLTHPHTVYMAYSECLPTRVNPLAERACFSFPRRARGRPPDHALGQGDALHGVLTVISDCHFRKTATEYDRKPGIKWLSCTEK